MRERIFKVVAKDGENVLSTDVIFNVLERGYDLTEKNKYRARRADGEMGVKLVTDIISDSEQRLSYRIACNEDGFAVGKPARLEPEALVDHAVYSVESALSAGQELDSTSGIITRTPHEAMQERTWSPHKTVRMCRRPMSLSMSGSVAVTRRRRKSAEIGGQSAIWALNSLLVFL